MYSQEFVVGSYVVINQGCPLAYSFEGPDHVQILFGRRPGNAFELLIERDAMPALMALCSEALTTDDSEDPRWLGSLSLR